MHGTQELGARTDPATTCQIRVGLAQEKTSELACLLLKQISGLLATDHVISGHGQRVVQDAVRSIHLLLLSLRLTHSDPIWDAFEHLAVDVNTGQFRREIEALEFLLRNL